MSAQASGDQAPDDPAPLLPASPVPTAPDPAVAQVPPHYSSDGKWWWNGQQWVWAAPTEPAGKNKTAAGLLGILLGGLGAHKFYLGQILMGVLYFLFCWTFIPALLGLAEGIVFLTLSDQEFERRYGTRERARQRPFF